MGLSNCIIEAWSRLRGGYADLICLQYTHYSRLHLILCRLPGWLRLALRVPYWPVQQVGRGVQILGWALIYIGEFLSSGRWLHASWRKGDAHLEYVPEGLKRYLIIPPILFRGHVQLVSIRSMKGLNGPQPRPAHALGALPGFRIPHLDVHGILNCICAIAACVT